MREHLNNFRTRRIEVGDLVDNLYFEYTINIKSVLESFETLDEVSEESRSELYAFGRQVELLKKMTFITDDESIFMLNAARAYRTDKLRTLESEDD